VLPGLIDLFLTLLLLVVLIPAYGVRPTWALLSLPLWVVFLVTVAFGIGLWLGALNVTYRDVNHGITLLVQLWLFASPVAYPSSQVPEGLKTFYGLNPMSGVIEGFRWALLGAPWPGDVILPSLVVTVVALVLGIAYFQKTERRFADVI
jgi:lipopolysaccharide transport system permease protein